MKDGKHRAMLKYLAQYPGLDAFLRFNSITDSAGNVSVQTVYSSTWEKRQIRNHGIKRYDFAIESTAPQDAGTSGVNVAQMQTAQDFMAWIDEQNLVRNFPKFAGCKVLSIENLQNMPSLTGRSRKPITGIFLHSPPPVCSLIQLQLRMCMMCRAG